MQGQLNDRYRDQLEVEETCRGFLEVAKVGVRVCTGEGWEGGRAGGAGRRVRGAG